MDYETFKAANKNCIQETKAAMRQLERSEKRFAYSLRVRVPRCFAAAVDVAAARNLMFSSEYVRRAVIKQLKADGIDPAQFKETN